MGFKFGAGRPSLDFIRTIRARRSEASEFLLAPDDLVRWIALSEVAPGLALGPLDAAAVATVRRLREAIYALVSARTAGAMPDATAVTLIDDAAQAPPPRPRLALSGDRVVALEADEPLVAVLSLLARDAIDLAASPLMARVRECADADCTAFFLDLSRPGTRRWCAMETCGNHAKLKTYRGQPARPAGAPPTAV